LRPSSRSERERWCAACELFDELTDCESGKSVRCIGFSPRMSRFDLHALLACGPACAAQRRRLI
jgi:hypothetical protein